MSAIELRGLTKRFGDVTALDRVDLDVHEGEIFGLLGPNGAGKTTAVRILVTLLRPDAGRAVVAGVDVVADPTAARRRIGYVPQEITADRYLSAREQLAFFTDLYHIPAARRAPLIDEMLHLVGLEAAADKRSRTYSGGMKKRLDLACGLLHEPSVLFLDEPSLGLDVPTRRAIWDHVRALRTRGVTVLLCTNDMDEADRLCDRLAIVDQGRIVAMDSPTALRAGLGGDVVTVEPLDGAGGGADRLGSVLATLPFVRTTQQEASRVHVFVDANETALPRVLEAASSAGIPLRTVTYSRPGLAEVFLKYAGRAYREADTETSLAATGGRKRKR